MRKPQLSYIVLASNNVTSTLAFYLALGLSSKEERHGEGPIHYSIRFVGLVLEIYSLDDLPGANVGGGAIGLSVFQRLETIKARLRVTGFKANQPIIERKTDRVIILEDPDGRAVRVHEQKPG